MTESLIRRGRQTSEQNRSFAILRERVGARYTSRSSQLRRVSSFEFRMQVPGWRSENRSGGPRFAGLAGWLAGYSPSTDGAIQEVTHGDFSHGTFRTDHNQLIASF